MSLWQVFQNTKRLNPIHSGPQKIAIPYTFDSYDGWYYNRYGAGPYPSSGGQFNTPNELQDYTQLCNNCTSNNCSSIFYFQIELPTSPTLGRVTLDLELLDPTNGACEVGGSTYYGTVGSILIADSFGGPYTLQEAASKHLSTSFPRQDLDPVTEWTYSGSRIKWMQVFLSNNYRVDDLFYTMHGLYWEAA